MCGSFCIFPGVYSLKRKINISTDDLIIVKHTNVAVCIYVYVNVRGFASGSICTLLRSRLLYLHVWSEHLSSSSSRRCETVRKAGAAALRRDTFKPLLQRYQAFPKRFHFGRRTCMQTDAFLFFFVISHLSPCHIQPSFI